jgi:hypothetical protein
MLLCYNYQNGITNEEDIIFVMKPKLFTIGIISLFDIIKSMKTRCRNPSLGLVTKARAYKSARQEGSLAGTSYTLGNGGECERMNLHIPT